MNQFTINGIQQIGLGVNDLYEAWEWYLKAFDFDLPIFDEKATAELMLPYTNGSPKDRHAALVYNYQGGGGLEIWQHLSITSRPPIATVKPGDIGIWAIHIKVKSIKKSIQSLEKLQIPIISIDERTNSFYTKDPYENIIKIVAYDEFLTNKGLHSGGILGCSVGVTDIERSLPFYQSILGYDQILDDYTGEVKPFNALTPQKSTYRVINLTHTQSKNGPFSALLGKSQIQLVQNLDQTPATIFADRIWGELGYIHLCFDTTGMDALKQRCAELTYPFTVDSGDSFDMGEAAGRFAYTEDPDGTLIEFVETHKISLFKKIGWYYNVQKRQHKGRLPSWLIWAMGLNRIKNVRKKG